MVREVRHRADEERRDEQRDKTKAAGRDWQEEDARAHGRAEERDGPLRIKGALGRRSLIHYDLQFFAGFLSSDNATHCSTMFCFRPARRTRQRPSP